MKIDETFLTRIKNLEGMPKIGDSETVEEEHATFIVLHELFRIATLYDQAGISMTPRNFIKMFAEELHMDLTHDEWLDGLRVVSGVKGVSCDGLLSDC